MNRILFTQARKSRLVAHLPRLALCLLLGLTGAVTQLPAQSPASYDVVVVGATPAGIAAAVNAARQGKTVALMDEAPFVGGLLSGGLPKADFRSFEAVQGTFREFMNRVETHYAKQYGPQSAEVKLCLRGAQFEPKVARLVFEQMLKEQKNIRVFLKHRLQSAVMKPAPNGRNRITGIRLVTLPGLQPLELTGKVFIDATYEGDLMAAAGVPYRVGRESRREYGELYAGVVYFSDHWANGGRILPGSTGEADKGVQSYNMRYVMSENPAKSIPISKPDGYKRADFQPALDYIKAGKIKSLTGKGEATPGLVWIGSQLPNDKRDVNDNFHSPFTLSLPGEVDAWPEGSPAVRKRIYDRHKYHTLGLFYFLQTDSEVPEPIRAEARRYGLPNDEWPETDHFTPLLYVREGRRMVGEYVFTEHDALNAPGSIRTPLHKTSIAVGDYSLDCHAVKKPDNLHPGIPEGAFSSPTVPYQIPYEIMLPKTVDGLLVPVAVSASHVGFATLRMEPTWTALGQAAGLAAALAINETTEVRDVDRSQLQANLHGARAITVYVPDVDPQSPQFKATQYFGTRGFFNDLINPATATFSWPKSAHQLGAPSYPNHEVGPEKVMDPELATRWLTRLNDREARVRASADPKLQPDGKLTRGEFLQMLYLHVLSPSN